MTRKLEKKRYELFPYAGIGIISFNTIHSLLIFDLNVLYVNKLKQMTLFDIYSFNIFVYRRKFGGFAAESVEGIPLSSKRAEVLEAMGSPTKHGRPLDDPQLGRYGAWDRFDRTSYAIHVQYQADADAIEMITLMHHSAVP